MTFKEAVGVLVSAAEVRMLQWEGVEQGKSPDDLVDELHESDEREARDMANIIAEAIRVVRKIYP
jgi:hypothetical protein